MTWLYLPVHAEKLMINFLKIDAKISKIVILKFALSNLNYKFYFYCSLFDSIEENNYLEAETENITWDIMKLVL